MGRHFSGKAACFYVFIADMIKTLSSLQKRNTHTPTLANMNLTLSSRLFQLVTATILVATLSGTAWSAPPKTLQGVWHGRPKVEAVDATIPDTSGGLLEDQKALAEQFAKTVQLKFDFRSNSNVIMSMIHLGKQQETKQGTWKILLEDGDSLHIEITVIEITAEDKARKVTKRLNLTFQGKDQFTAKVVNGDTRVSSLVFKRSKQS